MMEMLVEASMGVQIPDSDLNEGRASKPIAAAKGVEGSARFAVHVNSSRERPPAGEAFVSVRYPNRWFWLPDRDIGSKRSLGFLMLPLRTCGVGHYGSSACPDHQRSRSTRIPSNSRLSATCKDPCPEDGSTSGEAHRSAVLVFQGVSTVYDTTFHSAPS